MARYKRLYQNYPSLCIQKLRQETIKTQDISHDVNVTVSGIKITFQLTLDKIEDFTVYTIKACNKMVCNELTVKITFANRQKPPTNVSVISFDRNLAVSWCPGYNGGFPQTFFVEYQAVIEEIWKLSGPVIDNREIRMSKILYDITPNIRYNVRICGVNYTDITFNETPTMQDAVIHGSVDRTIYSEID
ncbi:unnamed protein product [Mytilus coruscus]|uniref:Fibronectin type-III domain-containing protein n=1 Tax=Mytilus coruscus TaxID=42192 RepID=A0A6J8ET98_MYTCO|nr:unnamed protein product [Mytilus coruscus]